MAPQLAVGCGQDRPVLALQGGQRDLGRQFGTTQGAKEPLAGKRVKEAGRVSDQEVLRIIFSVSPS